MIHTITMTRTDTSESIEFSDNSVFVIDKIDWDSPSVKFSTYKVPQKIGVGLSGMSIGSRKPEIIGYVIASPVDIPKLGMSWKEYYRRKEQSIEENKMLLDSICQVGENVILNANGYSLLCTITKPVMYADDEKKNNDIVCSFKIQLECFESPMFYKGVKKISLTSVTDSFIFPLVIPEKGYVFGKIEEKSTKMIQNDGDVSTGCIIKIEAKNGVVEDPMFYNIATMQQIKFKGVKLNKGDYIVINTNIGEEDAYKHEISTGQDTTVTYNLTAESVFLQIEKGKNYYGCSVAEEQQKNMIVSVEYKELYFNLRGM